jgi:hypothetical protein
MPASLLRKAHKVSKAGETKINLFFNGKFLIRKHI